MSQQLLHLLRLASETMEDPGLACAMLEAQEVVHGVHAVDENRQCALFAQTNLGFEGRTLTIVRRVAETIQPTFPYQEITRTGKQRLQVGFPRLGKVPGVQAISRKGGFPFGQGTMGMKIEIFHYYGCKYSIKSFEKRHISKKVCNFARKNHLFTPKK